MTIIESIRKYMEKCPELLGDRINVDFLPADASTYSVDVVPVKPVIRRYLDGSSRCQFLFTFATRFMYGSHVRQQLANAAVFEHITEWIDQQNRRKIFPDLGAGRTPLKLEVNTSGYVFAPEADTARYQIQLRLEYFQKGDK